MSTKEHGQRYKAVMKEIENGYIIGFYHYNSDDAHMWIEGLDCWTYIPEKEEAIKALQKQVFRKVREDFIEDFEI